MTLDLSEYTSTTDTPEVAALKETVIKVAKKYTNQHGWCHEVDRALKEMGITQAPKPLLVHVTTTHPFEFDVRMDVTELVGKTEAQQKAAIITKMGDIYLSGNSAIRKAPTIKLSTADIVDMTLPPKPEASTNWKYASSDGRVKHWFPDSVVSGDRNGYAACGNSYGTPNSIRDDSPRGTGNNCAKCTARNPA